jgi:hypothetical protein
MYVQADIFTVASHKRVLLSGWFVVSTQTLLQKGRPFILRLINGSVYYLGNEAGLTCHEERESDLMPSGP